MDHLADKEIGKLYAALMNEGDKNDQTVTEMCEKYEEGPLHLSIQKGTVLHVASFYEKTDLVLKLLDQIRTTNKITGLTVRNDIGNTVLHDAAASDLMVGAAREMLSLAPELLVSRNNSGETAVFRAVRFGQIKMFDFLEEKIEERRGEMEEDEWKRICWKEDGTTVLHFAVLFEHFELALKIAEKHEELVNAEDGDKMTALQLLAHNSSAFRSGRKQGWLKRRLYACIPSHGDPCSKEESDKSCWRIPLFDEIRMEKRRHEYTMKLAKFLIERDVSWKETFTETVHVKPKTHGYGTPSSSSEAQNANPNKKYRPQTPLILAIRSGIIEIVEEIIKVYPQAVEYIDYEGHNILHGAVKYRKMDIFYLLLKEMEHPMELLTRKLDSKGNSLLHVVGIRVDIETVEKMGSPLVVLQEDLVRLENIKQITKHLINHRNNEGYTADELSAKTYKTLRTNATDWLKRTAENCSIVGVLIATVAFAAAYTVPGGLDQETGYPILQHENFFEIFTFTDVLSLAFALTSVITFLSILTSPFRLKDFMSPLPQKLMVGVTLLMLSVSMMMFAFASTVILMIQDRKQWARIAVYIAVLLPVSIFMLSYGPLYQSLLESFRSSLKTMGKAVPRFNFKQWSCLRKARKHDKLEATNASLNKLELI